MVRTSMPIEIGKVDAEALFQYPVKSMGGERLEEARWAGTGLEGDRRLAFRRTNHRGGFPCLTASKLPELLLFVPQRREDAAPGDLPTHVCTPDGAEMPILAENLATEVGRRYGVSGNHLWRRWRQRQGRGLMQLKHGTFDEASISVIT